MAHKTLLSKILGLNLEDKRIDMFLSDPEMGELLRPLLDEVQALSNRVAVIREDIKEICKLDFKDWTSLIEKIIAAEAKSELALMRTLKRKKEIEAAVKVALEEGMSQSDIRTIIEVMVMGMQPGDASYLLPKDDN